MAANECILLKNSFFDQPEKILGSRADFHSKSVGGPILPARLLLDAWLALVTNINCDS
jgi:hypothetical protein